MPQEIIIKEVEPSLPAPVTVTPSVITSDRVRAQALKNIATLDKLTQQ